MKRLVSAGWAIKDGVLKYVFLVFCRNAHEAQPCFKAARAVKTFCLHEGLAPDYFSGKLDGRRAVGKFNLNLKLSFRGELNSCG